ncbi:saponin hydrolase precursor [Fusarium coicis]|nr:saponin hydrolase precursor [Fusarium coicis]
MAAHWCMIGSIDTGGEQDFQSGDFTPNGKHIVANVVSIGAPAAPDPASIYDGEQLILITTDGINFPNGDPWKCITCDAPSKNAPWLDPQRDYPHVFRSGDKALWGYNIVSCGGKPLASDGYTPSNTHIYPVHWTVTTDGTGKVGSPREMRLHPDDEHMGWSSFTNTGGQYTYFGRLEFKTDPKVGEPLVPRGSGDEILYIGSPVEANNIDVMAVHLTTGTIRRLTSHPNYTDPITMSHDNQWIVAMDTRVVGRQMFMSAFCQPSEVSEKLKEIGALETRVTTEANICQGAIGISAFQKMEENSKAARQQLREIASRFDGEMMRLLKQLNEDERCKIDQWVPDIPYESDHYIARKGRVEDTGE